MASVVSSTKLEIVGSINPNASPPTIACPAGLAAGHLLLVSVFFAQGNGGGSTAMTTPANMTKISNDGTTTNRAGAIFAAIVDDPADFAGGILLHAVATSTRVVAMAVAFAPTAGKEFTPEGLACSALSWGSASMTSKTYPGGVSGDMVLGIAMANRSPATGATIYTSADGTLVDYAVSPSAASGSVSESGVSVDIGGTAVNFSLAQANAQSYSVGVTESTSGGGLPDVTGHGFVSVTQMLQTPGATWAHRNLGGTYPEMTEYGCRMAANAGYGVIEISCQRTSDAVLIGSHDATPNRVAVETTYDGTNFSALTSAQVLSLHAGVGSTGAPQSFATLTQLIQTLPEDFIFLVDNKPGTFMADFLTLCDTLGGPTRIIVKIDGAATFTRFQQAQAAGYKTAAYFYDTTPSAKIIENMPYVDLPGLNYDAAQSYWDDLLAFGKPVWGHVCATQGNADMAMTKGATFIQSTSVSIAPVGVESWNPPMVNSSESTNGLERQFLLNTVPGAAANMSLGDLRALSGFTYRPRSYYITALGLASNAPLSRDDARRQYFLQELGV